MKWIGQHIWDFISRFRSDVYLEDLSTTTDTSVLVVDSNNKVCKNTTTLGGDITGVTLTSDSGSASDSTGNADLTIAGGNAIGTTATGSTVTINHTDTSSQSTVNNSGSAVIQDVTLDNYGHVTGLASATLNNLAFSGSTANGVLTYGGSAQIDVESNLTFTGSTMTIGDGGTGASQVEVKPNASGGGGRLYFVSGNATDGQTNASGGHVFSYSGRPTGNGAFGQYAWHGGTIGACGTTLRSSALWMALIGTATTTDFTLYSHQDSGDKLDISVATNGATTITTTDDDAAAANLQITADGTAELAGTTVTLDSAGAVTFERGSSTVEVPDVAGTLQVVDLVKYLLPSDFMVNDAAFVRGYQYAADDGDPYGGTWQDPGLQAWGWYQIPKGFKITHMYARGNSTHASTDCSIYQLDPEDGTRGSALASGVWGTNRSLSTAITSADDAVALVVLTPEALTATAIIFSVMLTLAEV